MTDNKKQTAIKLKLEFLERNGCIDGLAPLQFKIVSQIDNRLIERDYFPETLENLDDVIEQILILKDRYCSLNIKTDVIETKPNKNRSSLDIWRHVIFFYPDVTLSDVMNSLYNLVGKEIITTLYCCDIHRRVFLIRPEGIQHYMDKYSRDEYGLYLYEWED